MSHTRVLGCAFAIKSQVYTRYHDEETQEENDLEGTIRNWAAISFVHCMFTQKKMKKRRVSASSREDLPKKMGCADEEECAERTRPRGEQDLPSPQNCHA